MERLSLLYPGQLPDFPAKSLAQLSAKKLQKRIDLLKIWFAAVAKLPSKKQEEQKNFGF
jgi:hypothetical protein